jgi:4-amino-4-deoxy-L-arabinose transferase-like glycosyltransferase
MPDWIPATLAAFPAILWMISGLGLPWALVILPRKDWADRVMVACLSFAFGPAILTAWMFVLGTLGQNHDPDAGHTVNPMQTVLRQHSGGDNLLRPDLILLGTALIAAIGILLAWRKKTTSFAPEPTPRRPFARDERILILLIILATVARWFLTSWLKFGAYDPLWVYGYQGRIYTLAGYIPADIGYYPQFLSLQYAYAQIVGTGGIDDHAARAVLPFLQVGSILVAYLLGSRLFKEWQPNDSCVCESSTSIKRNNPQIHLIAIPHRRTGIIAAALWALYPHFGYWTRIGDLEIPVTFGFSGAALFFLLAWTETATVLRRRYAMIAGLFLGIAMWTKPTSGAFILGVILLVVVDFLRVRNWQAWWPRFEVAVITGLACLPLGGGWYLRNLFLGHDAVVFPDAFWRDWAMRSGAEFGWPLLALTILLVYVYFGPHRFRPNRVAGGIGTILVAAGVLPTILEPARMQLLEWVALLVGSVILTITLLEYGLSHLALNGEKKLAKLSWALLLALPYFIVWFMSYSYHYRLSFSIVPLMLLPSAVILADWFTVERVQQQWRLPRRMVYLAVVFGLGLPGIAITINDSGEGWDWLWTTSAEGDYSVSGLWGVVDTLQDYIDIHDDVSVVSAPGLRPLSFFFPEIEMRVEVPPYETQELDGVAIFVDSTAAQRAYGFPAPGALSNQWYTSLFRENVTRKLAHFHDFNEIYTVYELHIEDRFVEPDIDLVEPEGEVVFGGMIRYLGYYYPFETVNQTYQWSVMVFEVLQEIPADYSMYVHLVQEDHLEKRWAGADGPVREEFNAPTYYATRFWEVGEYIIDRRIIWQHNRNTPPGDDYRLRIGFYDVVSGQRLPVTINGDPAGDGYLLEGVYSVLEWAD